METKKGITARCLAAVAAVALFSGAAAAQGGGGLCWDNDLEPNGFNARTISPPAFPEIRCVDDFTVPTGGWTIEDFHVTVVEDDDWVAGVVFELYVYSDDGGQPLGGGLITSRTGAYMRQATGGQLFNRAVYEYWFEFPNDPIDIGSGVYWIGHRCPDGGGSGTNYWATSNGGEGTARTGYLSLDFGGSWVNEGANWHHAFEITGQCGGAEGACCFDDGSCTFGPETDCIAGGGTYQGDGVTCADADCPQPGACCFDDGSCTFGFETDCIAGGGTYQGDGVTCADADCPQPGACCFDDGSCTFGFETDCIAGGGTYQGDGVTCADANCPQPGACCFDDGSCTFGFETDCIAGGGEYQGDGITCGDVECDQPGACCLDNGDCVDDQTKDSCQALGGTYRGDGTDCGNVDCPQPGACCFDDGSCTFGFETDCIAGGGTYQGDGVTCADADCPQPGACCFDDGSCTFGFETDCIAGGGEYQGDGVTCGDVDCSQKCEPCKEDSDGDCEVNFGDLLRVLSTWGPCEDPPGPTRGELRRTAIATAGLPALGGDLCWDNNIVGDGFNARAMSPPLFPDIRVADDFEVPTGGIDFTDAHFGVMEDDAWIPGDVLEVVLYEQGQDDLPGAILAVGAGPYQRMDTGEMLFDRIVYHYWIFFEPFPIDSGKYWISVRNPLGAGSGTNYWLTSDGGPDGAGSKFGAFSLDSGSNWMTAGVGWQHAFEITCDTGCVPCPADNNGDCIVDFDDLLRVLSAWGPCEDP